jgi:hypothetical protein
MSFESDLIQSASTKSTVSTDESRQGLFFAPAPQHTDAPPPELFDQEVAELDLDFAFKPIDGFLPTLRDSIRTIPDSIPFISTPSPLTDSTVAVYGGTHSSDFTNSDYLTSSENGSYNNDAYYGTHDFIHSPVFSNGQPSIPPLHPGEAQFDSGTSDLSPNIVGIYPVDLSTATQPPIPLPVHVTPDSEAQMAPALDGSFKCPHFPHCKADTN